MTVDWKGLIEGVRNKIVPSEELKPIIEETAKERMAICDACEWKRGTRCGKCGCFLVLKTRCLSCECPIQKWLKVMEKEEGELVKGIINGSDNS